MAGVIEKINCESRMWLRSSLFYFHFFFKYSYVLHFGTSKMYFLSKSDGVFFHGHIISINHILFSVFCFLYFGLCVFIPTFVRLYVQ